MLMPSIFGESLFDQMFERPFGFYRGGAMDSMRTDIKENDGGYEITMNLPGVQKEHVKGELKDGYLTVTAVSDSNKEEKDSDNRYIRRERYMGSCSRSFYVGENVTQDEIKAKFENGTLKLLIPKKEVQPAVEDRKYIAIEG